MSALLLSGFTLLKVFSSGFLNLKLVAAISLKVHTVSNISDTNKPFTKLGSDFIRFDFYQVVN